MAASSKETLMLKDYLMDDLGSCSSNGFGSFPRRQCCSTVRFLLEIDLKERDSAGFSPANPLLRRSRSKRFALTSLSAFLRAPEAVFIAVKNLTFASGKSSSSSSQSQARRDHCRHRNRSLKLLSKSFWKKLPDQVEPEIRMWKSFSVFHDEDEKSLDINPLTSINANSTALISNRVSTNTVCCQTSWSESEFKAENSVSPDGISASSTETDAVDSEQQSQSEVVSRRVGVNLPPYPEPSTKEWSSEEEKEQFSPVSVLDCPFQDEEETSSPSQCSLQGAEQQLMQKIRRFKDLAQLEPLDLQQRFVVSELEEEAELFTQPLIVNEEAQTDHKAVELLNLIKAKNWSNSFASISENILLDFFREKIEETTSNLSEFAEILKVAEDWLNGLNEELWRGWEVQEGREAYGREMEKGGRWRKMDEEKEEEGLEMEDEVWSGLLDELLVDLL